MTTSDPDGLGVVTLTADYYRLGWDAHDAGHCTLDCPVLLVSADGQDWLAGWADASTTPAPLTAAENSLTLLSTVGVG